MFFSDLGVAHPHVQKYIKYKFRLRRVVSRQAQCIGNVRKSPHFDQAAGLD